MQFNERTSIRLGHQKRHSKCCLVYVLLIATLFSCIAKRGIISCSNGDCSKNFDDSKLFEQLKKVTTV
jgi:hypothetical protein